MTAENAKGRGMSAPGGPDRESALARTLVTIADTLVGDFDVNDLFDLLTSACVDLLGVATAGLMLADRDGTLQLMASSSETMRTLELFEINHAEGPCLDCYAQSRVVSVGLEDPSAADRWPLFATEAGRAGITAVMAVPMRLRGDTIGALNLFHTQRSGLDAHETELAQALADVATIAILQRRALSSSELLAEQLQAALNDRIVIEQAKGLLAERGQLSIDQAFTVLRDFCRSARLPLTRTARELITATLDPDDVLAHRWPKTP
jgi:GAF domain-containing protein